MHKNLFMRFKQLLSRMDSEDCVSQMASHVVFVYIKTYAPSLPALSQKNNHGKSVIRNLVKYLNFTLIEKIIIHRSLGTQKKNEELLLCGIKEKEFVYLKLNSNKKQKKDMMAFSKYSLIKIKLGKDAYLTKQFTTDMVKMCFVKGIQ